MPDFLSEMRDRSLARASDAARAVPERQLRDVVAGLPRQPPFPADGFLLIAEVKRTSPAAGALADPGLDIVQSARAYVHGGAAVISVLTEPSRFQGSIDDLRHVARAVAAPVMRKDFLTDPYQVLEARAAGAAGVLLIVKMLNDASLRAMLGEASRLGMFSLIESFDLEDLERSALLLGTATDAVRARVLLGLNSRDLRDLRVRPQRLAELAAGFPAGYRRIAESGIQSPADAHHAAALGYSGILVGTALMRAQDPAALCRSMLEAAHAAQGAAP